MKKTLLLLVVLIQTTILFGQDRSITGTVIDTEKLPLIGASVIVKQDAGITPIGTITDIDGNFNLKVPAGKNTLVVSYIGFETKEVDITGKNNISVTLGLSSTELDAVVVTALGIKKEKKALGYAFTDVKGDELTANRDVNFINSISNKVAGVNISQTAGGAGTSSRIVIRGIKSLSTESQPLIVVDGVPMDNGSDGASWLGGLDYGNSLMGISPDDIESMSVLKGPNAAALYGSRAARGVIMITTKKGSSRDKFKVSYSSSFMFDQPYIHAKYQNEYGAGFGGSIGSDEISEERYLSLSNEEKAYVRVSFDSTEMRNKYNVYRYVSTGSWGARMDTDTLHMLNWNDEFVKYEAHPDNVKDYFKTGYTFINSLAFENGTEKYNWRLSLSDLENQGLKPNSEYARRNINYSMNSKLNDIFSTSFKANYIREDAFNRAGQGDSRTGARNFIWMPRSIDIHRLESDYKNENGLEQNWYNDSDWHTNPYWEAYENYNNDYKDQFIGFAKFEVNFTPWLKGFVRSSMDTYLQKRYLRIANNAARANGIGSYTEGWKKYRALNHDFLLTANYDINDDLSLSANGGGNYYNIHRDYQSTTINGLAIPNNFSLNNKLNPDETSTGSDIYNEVIQSFYASVNADYKGWAFLELTGRNDWSSTLPIDKNDYFYYSVNSSVVVTDALGLDDKYFSFGKVRFSYAKVGNDTKAYQLKSEFINQQYGSLPAVYLSNSAKNPNLEPESNYSWELGTDLRFFQNRIGLDVTYYSERTEDLITTAEVSKVTGAKELILNGGVITNKGIEIQMNATPIKTPDFEWDLSMNYTKNKNEVLELYDELTQFTITNESQIDVVAIPGRPYGDIIGTRLARYDNPGHPNHGMPLVDENGAYIMEERGVIGNITPDWTGGVTNNFRYKNVSLSFSIGVKIGGDIFSKTNKYGLDNGQFEETLEGRDSWYSATQEERDAGTVGYIAEGVYAPGVVDADSNSLVGQINVTGMDPQQYFHQRKWGGIAELDVYDASYVKLRDISLNYNMPSYWFENSIIDRASIAFVAKNVWLIYSGVPNIDPESSFTSNNNGLGQEYGAMPPTRSFGFNLNVVF